MSTKLPTAFLPHGGGPWPVIPLPQMIEEERVQLSDYLKSIGSLSGQRPKFLVVISAHWEEETVTVHVGEAPKMLFDYYGFPPEAYTFDWPAKGAPTEGEQTIALLEDAGFKVSREKSRGFDHGTFIPLMLSFPLADIPVVQVSLKKGLDPAEHFAIGKALAPLREQGGFIIGSGNSYHNLRKFFRPDALAQSESNAFDAWLNAAVTSDPTSRQKLLVEWASAPSAIESHPREEHLIPLMVVAGAAGHDSGTVGWEGSTNTLKISAHHFGV